jgi:LruC domain-containing protein
LGYSRNITDGQTEFVDENNYSFAIIFPENWLIPIEHTDLRISYPNFLDYIQSHGNNSSDWHQPSHEDKVRPLTPAVWKW